MSDGNHEIFMRRALREARKARGRTAPNPCVGAVIVKDNQIIATGYHRRAGTPHPPNHGLRAAGAGGGECGGRGQMDVAPIDTASSKQQLS